MRFEAASFVAMLAPMVAAHGAVTSYIVGDTTYPGYEGFSPSTSPETIQFQWPDYNPTLTVTDEKMRCNGGTSADLSAPVTAGQNITACAGELASCTGEGQGWFKIDQMGLFGTSLTSEDWGTGIVLKKLEWSSEVPKNLAPGNYLIRHELLALHQSNTPQFYAECAQIAVQGSGAATPPTDYTYSIPGYAPQSDPGITVSSLPVWCSR